MDEKYTAFSQNLSLDNHCLSGISPFFSHSPAKNAFTVEILYTTKSATSVHAATGIIEI